MAAHVTLADHAAPRPSRAPAASRPDLAALAARAEAGVVALSSRLAPALLRFALASTFLWFGALKVAGASPVAALVARAVPLGGGPEVVRLVGIAEVAIGAGLLFSKTRRLALIAFFLQMLGTFSVLVRMPDLAFQSGNPLLLTTLGEFVVKNVVLLAAGVAIVGSEKSARA